MKIASVECTGRHSTLAIVLDWTLPRRCVIHAPWKSLRKRAEVAACADPLRGVALGQAFLSYAFEAAGAVIKSCSPS